MRFGAVTATKSSNPTPHQHPAPPLCAKAEKEKGGGEQPTIMSTEMKR